MSVCENRSRSEPSVKSSSADIKPKMSPDLSPPGGAALISPTISGSNNQPADGGVGVKTEADNRAEGEGEIRFRRVASK